MEVPSEEPTAEEEMISSDMDDLDDPLTADSQSLGLGSPPPLATGLFRGRFAGESESPSMASELESGRPSPAADSLEQVPTQRSKVGHTSILLTFARFWPKGMEVRPPCVPSYF